MLNHNEHILSVIREFAIYGDFVSCKPVGNGHINNTYRSTFNQAGREIRYTHQRINKSVFKILSKAFSRHNSKLCLAPPPISFKLETIITLALLLIKFCT